MQPLESKLNLQDMSETNTSKKRYSFSANIFSECELPQIEEAGRKELLRPVISLTLSQNYCNLLLGTDVTKTFVVYFDSRII